MSKDKDLKKNTVQDAEQALTTNQGTKVSDDHNSLKAGVRGPSLLEDFILREKITHFDHERIPERVVHARGAGAHGIFQVYESLADVTCAGFLTDLSRKTPVFVRFSTVAGSRGSADTARDVRGFAVKFYTEEGIFDLVGNNIPVFFIQDAIKFPDLIHAVKPEPHHEMPQAASAHDTFYDFISLMPESIHMLMWAMSDRAIPVAYSRMEGFGIHTFRLVNAEGKGTFVKFHWKPVLGMASLVWDEAQKLAGKDPDWQRRDLWESIERGQFPEWELGLQLIPEADEHKFDFDLLDPTKLVPEEEVPVKIVGKLTLNRNPDNFFAETEQVAFHPGHLVPGIDFSNDPLLQGRLFSYTDTQLTRLGGPNFHEIPINRSVATVHNNQRDGFMRQTINRHRTSYEPNSLGGGCPMQALWKDGGFASYPEKVEGAKIRQRSDTFRDYFSQATLFFNSQTPVEQQHIIEALGFELGKCEHKHIRQRMCDLLHHVHPNLALGVAAQIGVTEVTGDISYLEQSTAPLPLKPKKKPKTTDSPALSIEKNKKPGIKGRKVAILVGEGVDELAVEAVKAPLAKGGAVVTLVGPKLGPVPGTGLQTEQTFKTSGGSVSFDGVIVPPGTAALANVGDAVHFVNEAFKHCKTIAACGEGVALLAGLKGVQLAETGQIVDQGVLTQAKASKALAPQFAELLGQHRHWDRPGKDSVPA